MRSEYFLGTIGCALPTRLHLSPVKTPGSLRINPWFHSNADDFFFFLTVYLCNNVTKEGGKRGGGKKIDHKHEVIFFFMSIALAEQSGPSHNPVSIVMLLK